MMLAFAGYTLEELIHKGAATLVYRGRREADGAGIILKTLRSDFPTAVERAMLRHEQAVLAELEGPGVLRVHALATSQGRLALVMEDVGLFALDRQLRARLDLGLTLRIGIALTAILRRAHARRIVHKDIKPHNILVGADPLRVYLIDWGIASRLGEAQEEGRERPDGEGTLAYLSPEQTGMLERPVGPRSDLYSLGVTLYQMLTGVLPFVEADPAALLHSHLTRAPAPPRDVDSSIPAQLSDIVMKLLAKSAEDRYASARGLGLDLEVCLAQLEERGAIEAFPLGRRDATGELRIPARLYGREADVAAVLLAFERARRGRAELLVITGHPGVGKSAVVREASGSMRLDGARIGAGKIEQFRDEAADAAADAAAAAPYTSLTHALRDVVRHIMTEPDDAVTLVKAAISTALGKGAGVLTQLVPELELLLGPQPPVAPLPPAETENRFHLAVQRLLSALATAERPLVLFFDDLQWAEPASLKLLERLLTDPENAHLLVIGAYRDHEEDRLKLLARTLDNITAGDGVLGRIALRPLALSDVHRLTADALHTPPAEAQALGEEIYRKTHGNPFYVVQLLRAWAQDGLLVFDEDAEGWTWDLAAISRSGVTDDVAAFLAQRLRRLPAATQEVLKRAACVGAEPDHDTLAQIAGLSTAACARALWPALAEGLLVPLHDAYRLLADIEETPGAPAVHESGVAYRFLHDHVQEAARSLLAEAERPRVHLRLARLLRDRHPGVVPHHALFTVADHLNIARPLVRDHEERLAAAELDLRAGLRAKASVAYAAARSYVAAGIAFLPDDAWETAYDLSFALRGAHAESVFLCGDFDDAAPLFQEVLERARTATSRAEIHFVRMQLYGTAYRFHEAARAGREALGALGEAPPETEEACRDAAAADLDALLARLRGRTLEELLAAPPLTDAKDKVHLRILRSLDSVSFASGSPALSALMSVRQALVSITRGPSELSAYGYASSAQALLRRAGKSDEVDFLMRLAVALHERYPSAEHAPSFCMTRAHSVALLHPIRDAIASYDEAAETSLAHGNLMMFQFSATIALMLRLLAGDEELDAVAARHKAVGAVMRRARYENASMIIANSEQAIACLQGRTLHNATFDDEHFKEDTFLQRAREKKSELILSCHWSLKLMVLCVHRAHEAALPLVSQAEARLPVLSQTMQGACSFYLCLVLAALIERASADDAARYRALLEQHHGALSARRELCDEAWRCQDLLVAAERARLAGDDLEAHRHYDQAITHAQRSGMARLFAMGSELYGRFAVARGLDRIARGCLLDAHQGYVRWGAAVHAAALCDSFPDHITPTIASAPSTGTTSRGTATVALQGILFDLGEAMRTARSISSELAATPVLERFLRAAGSYATMTRAFALLMRDGEPEIAGFWTASPDVVRTDARGPIAEAELAGTVVRYVARSHESVILRDVEHAALFADDPYIRAHRPRSLLCLPLVHHDRLVGMWYAESDVARDLRRGSIELLQLLAGHAASALENARLVAELEAASKDVSEANQRLRTELADRVRVERERSELQERVIAMQEEMLLELVSPLIPLSDSVAVLPLIGSIGGGRAARVIETALTGVHARRIRVLIIDVTGLREADEVTVNTLHRLAGALRMLGAQVVLTGVRPDVAQTLVGLRVDMKGIVMRSTLQSGITFALRGRSRM